MVSGFELKKRRGGRGKKEQANPYEITVDADSRNLPCQVG